MNGPARRGDPPTAGGTRLLLAAGVLGLAACGPPEGTRRPLVEHHLGDPPVERVRGEEVYQDGSWLKDGTFVFYAEDGTPTHEGRYVAGLEEGPWVERDASGGSGRGTFTAGVRQGEWTYFDALGHRVETGHYEQGQRIGTWRAIWPDGTPRREVSYTDGLRHGEVRVWNEDGELDPVASGRWNAGQRVGDLPAAPPR